MKHVKREMFKIGDHNGKLRSITQIAFFLFSFVKKYFKAVLASVVVVVDFTVVSPILGLVKG